MHKTVIEILWRIPFIRIPFDVTGIVFYLNDSHIIKHSNLESANRFKCYAKTKRLLLHIHFGIFNWITDSSVVTATTAPISTQWNIKYCERTFFKWFTNVKRTSQHHVSHGWFLILDIFDIWLVFFNSLVISLNWRFSSTR